MLFRSLHSPDSPHPDRAAAAGSPSPAAPRRKHRRRRSPPPHRHRPSCQPSAVRTHRPAPSTADVPEQPSSPASSPRRPRIAQKNWPRWCSSEPSGEPSRRSTCRKRLFPGAPQVLLRSLPVLSGSWIRSGSSRSPPPWPPPLLSHRRRKWAPASSEGSWRPGSPSGVQDSCPGARGPACDPKVHTTG